jgi:hypothetical protein
MFSRNVKLQVDIAPAHGDGMEGHKMHCVNFTLLAGPGRRFKRLSELLQSMILSNRGTTVAARRISSDLCSDSSSSSFCSIDRVSPTPPPEPVDPFVRERRRSQRGSSDTPPGKTPVIANGKSSSANSSTEEEPSVVENKDKV